MKRENNREGEEGKREGGVREREVDRDYILSCRVVY